MFTFVTKSVIEMVQLQKCESIEEIGLQQPVVVFRKDRGVFEESVELIQGDLYR